MSEDDLSVEAFREFARRLRDRGDELNGFLGKAMVKGMIEPPVSLAEIAREGFDVGLSAEEIVLCLEACEEMRAVQARSARKGGRAAKRSAAQRETDRLRTQFRRDECDIITWGVLSDAVKRRDAFKCQYCGTTEGPFEADHVLPVSRGGRSAMPNLVCACRPCNSAKAGRTPEEWRS